MTHTIQNLIKSAGPPTKIAKALNLSIPTIGSWTTNGHIPWKHLTKVFDLAGTDPKDYPSYMDANSVTLKNAATPRDFAILKSLLANDPEHVAKEFDLQVRIIKGIYTKNKHNLKDLVEFLTRLQQPFHSQAELTAHYEAYAKAKNITTRQARRLGERYCVEPPELATTKARSDSREATKTRRQREATYYRLFISRHQTMAQLADALGKNTDYMYRVLRNLLENFGETTRSIQYMPEKLRYSLALDAYNHLTGAKDRAFYPLFRHILSISRPKKIVPHVVKDPKSTHYADLLPDLVNAEYDISAVAKAKGAPESHVIAQVSAHLSPFSLTWTDVESMDSTNRATLFDILTTRALKRGDVSPITQ